MDASLLGSSLDRIQKVSRNAEKTFAMESKVSQTKLDSLSSGFEDRSRSLRSVADQLDATQKKITDYYHCMENIFDSCKKRLVFVEDARCDEPETLLNWLLIGYLARRGWMATAKCLAERSGLSDMVDLGIFEQSYKILKELSEYNTGPALAWCKSNRSRLQGLGSNLEFHLRLRDFVVLVAHRDWNSAISYIKMFLPTGFETDSTVFRRHIALLALFEEVSSKPIPTYSDLLLESCWRDVQQMFVRDFYRLHNVPENPQLDLYLKTGLSALKTHYCGTPDKSMIECPVCTQDVVELAAKLNPSPRTMSSLVCRLSGNVMDETNPPMALPNGQVYSRSALKKLADAQNGTVKCPETGSMFLFTSCRHVYVL